MAIYEMLVTNYFVCMWIHINFGMMSERALYLIQTWVAPQSTLPPSNTLITPNATS